VEDVATFKILACGSRDWLDIDNIRQELLHQAHEVAPPGAEIFVICGCERGASALSSAVAFEEHWVQRFYSFNRARFGKDAEARRNLEMLRLEPDVVLAFWDGESTSTAHLVTESIRREIHTIVLKSSGARVEFPR